MSNNPNSVKYNEEFTLPCSVDIFLPPHYEKMLSGLAGSGEYPLPSGQIISDALRHMRASEMTKEERRAETRAVIQRGLDSGTGRELTPEFLEEMEQHIFAYHEWLKTQEDKLGNTTLSEELYQYIQNKIASGHYANATEVVCAALDKLAIPIV